MTLAREATSDFGALLRGWRRRRRLSQLALAGDAEISSRHLSFLETGRAKPSREMTLRLAEALDAPLRERNAMLLAAGFAPAFPARSLDAPDMAAAREAMDKVLKGLSPFPALCVDRHWRLVAANDGAAVLLEGLAPASLAAPVNALRLSLRADGLGPRIANYDEWRAHCLARLKAQAHATGDPALAALLDELRALPRPPGLPRAQGAVCAGAGAPALVVPLRLRVAEGELNFLSTTTVFGAPMDVTLSELAIESFLPADAFTGAFLRARL